MTASIAEPISTQSLDAGPFSGVRVLRPETCKMFKGLHSLLHVQVADDDDGLGLYRAVHAVRAFPVSSPNEYIVLKYPDELGIDREVGLILNISEFPAVAQELIHESLMTQYFEYSVTRIYGVTWKFHLLFFDVETTQGRLEFQMRWQVDRAQDYGDHSKVLLDVSDNRYVIQDIRELPKADREKYLRYIYW